MDSFVQVEGRRKGKNVVLMQAGSTVGIATTTTSSSTTSSSSSSTHMHPITTTSSSSTHARISSQPTINSLPEELIERILELCVASPPFMPARPEWHQGAGCRVPGKGGEKGSVGANANGGGLPPRSRTLPCIPVAVAGAGTDMGVSSHPVIRTRLAPLLVNKRFNRIGTPLFYGTVLVRHEGQAKALGEVLWGSMSVGGGLRGGLYYNEDLGRFIHTLILGGSWEEGGGVVGACAVYSDVGAGAGVKRLDLTVTNAVASGKDKAKLSMDDLDSTVSVHPYRRQTLLEVLPKLRHVKHLTLRKGGGNTYLTQKRVGEVVRSVARGVRSWSGLETVCIAFKMSDDSLGTTTTTAVAAVVPAAVMTTPQHPPAPAPPAVTSAAVSATRVIHPPSLGATPTRLPVVVPSGRGQGQRSNSSPSRYMGSGGVLPLIRTNVSARASSSMMTTRVEASEEVVEGEGEETSSMSPKKMKASSFETSVFPSPASSRSPDSPVCYPCSQDACGGGDLDLGLPRELDSAGPCTVLAWAVANCVSKQLHTVVTHTPSVWNGVLVRIVDGRERYLSELGRVESDDGGRGGGGGLKRVVLVDPNMFGGMDDFAFLGRAFNGAAGDDEGSDDGVVDVCGSGGGVGVGCVGGLQRSRGDTFSMAYQSPGLRSPWGGFASSPTVPLTPMSPRSPGFGGAGGRGGLFRHGAKDHAKLAALIRKGDVWLSRFGGGGGLGGEVGGCGGGGGPSSFGLACGYGGGGGLNIGGVRTRAYTMGSTSSGMSG